ncbi:MAG: rhodanese-like domain-containing protein [Acidobacteriota bacterium]
MPRISVEEAKVKFDKKETIIVDVRAFVTTTIKGALHIPVSELEKRLKELPKNKLIIASGSCVNEATHGHAIKVLQSKGYTNVAALKSGQAAWEKAT